MRRPAITFNMARARQIHDVLAGIVTGIGRPRPHSTIGVETGSLFPIIVPMNDILAGEAHTDVTSAVYIVTGNDRIVRYVGSVDRSSPALTSRLQAHLRRNPALRQTWTGLGLVRVPGALTRTQVLHCEGWVGRILDPLDNDRLPFVGGQPWIPRRPAA